jgi:hypothetical protein
LLADVVVITGSLDEEAMALQTNDLMPTSHCFCVNTQKRVYYFCCDTAEDLVRWQRALQSLLPYNQNRTRPRCRLAHEPLTSRTLALVISPQMRRVRRPHTHTHTTQTHTGEDYDDPQAQGSRLEREVRRLFRDLREVISESGQDGDNGADHQDDAADDPYSDGDNGYVPKGKEAKREDSKKSSKKEERRREKEREWLRVIEAEMQQVETIDEEEERHEEWVRLKQALAKGMERALLRSDRRRAEFTLRAAAAKASSITADDSDDDSGEGEAAKKQKNEDGKTSKNESDAVARKNESENGGAVGRRREGTRRGKEGEEEDDGWNSDGFDTSREATMAREIMGLRNNADGEEGEDGEGDRTDDDDEDDDVEEEEDSLLESDKRRHAKRKRKSRRGRKKAPTRRIYSYGQETADVGFEGEPETDQQSFAGPGVNSNGVNYGSAQSSSSRKSFSDRRHDFDPMPSSSSFWSCFCC